MRALGRRVWRRRARRDHAIALQDPLLRRVEERSRAAGQSLDEAAGAVVEDLERAAAALNARTAPLVPGCGVLVAVTGILLKAEPSSDGARRVLPRPRDPARCRGLRVPGQGAFVYAGRPYVGLAPTVDDIAFARGGLVRKHADAHRGGWLAGIGLACLILGILFGIHISLNIG